MEQLKAVNTVLQRLGERPVSRLEVAHPTLAILLPTMDRLRLEMLRRGWWFNEYQTTLYPSVGGVVTVGDDVISFLPDAGQQVVLRGRVLIDTNTRANVTVPIKGRVTEDVQFEELPETAACSVMYNTLIDSYVTDLGMSNDLALWQQNAAQADSDLMAEHLRNKRYNTKGTRQWIKFKSALRS